MNGDTLRLAIDAFPDLALVTFGPDGRITCWSRGAQHLLGHEEDQALAQHVSAIFTGGEGSGGIRPSDLEQAAERGAVASYRWLRHRDGSAVHARATIVPLWKETTLVGYAAVAERVPPPDAPAPQPQHGDNRGRDTAAQSPPPLEALPEQAGSRRGPDDSHPAADGDERALSSITVRLQELQRAVATRDEFIATVAHELRNPLSPLTFQVRLTIDKVAQLAAVGAPITSDWIQSQLTRIEERLHRVLETLDRLLDVSRLSTGRIDLQLETVDLAEVAHDVVHSLEAELAVARCRLTIRKEGMTTGHWDRMRIEQICRNLLSNAMRFGAGHPIEVWLTGSRDSATLRVCDQGVGIAPDQQAVIFERFERGTWQRSGGFGIGLWIVRSICAAFGGTISVESEVGQGACFTVTLPRRLAPEAAIP